MTMFIKVISTLLATTFLVSCSSEPSSKRHSFKVHQEDAVTICENRGAPKFTGELFRYDPILTLLGDPKDEESLLFNPGEFTVDHDGFFFVEDYGNNRIAVFDPEGRYVRSFGREGDGPGEFRRLQIQFINDDEIHIYDGQRRRTTRYSTSGSLLSVISPPPEWASQLSELFSMQNGMIVISHSGEDHDNIRYTGLEGCFIADNGDTAAVIRTHPIPKRYLYRFGESGGGVGLIRYSGNPIIRYLPTIGVYATTGVEPEIKLYSKYGILQKIIRIELEPELVTQDERNAVSKQADESVNRARERGFGVEGREASRKALVIPDTKAFWEDILLDDSGYIWLKMPEVYDAETTTQGLMFRVLSPDGEYLGNTRWPEWMPGRVSGNLLFTSRFIMETGERIPTVYKISPIADDLIFP